MSQVDQITFEYKNGTRVEIGEGFYILVEMLSALQKRFRMQIISPEGDEVFLRGVDQRRGGDRTARLEMGEEARNMPALFAAFLGMNVRRYESREVYDPSLTFPSACRRDSTTVYRFEKRAG